MSGHGGNDDDAATIASEVPAMTPDVVDNDAFDSHDNGAAASVGQRLAIAPELLRQIVEGALLAAGKPLQPADLVALFDADERPSLEAVRTALAEIGASCAGRGFELREVASGFRFQVVQSVAPWIARLWDEKPQRYSRALLETLALIAYRQPITRGDIEEIRGVAVASNIMKTLLEREWVRIVGHKDVPGRPAMYATTRRFLDYFNLQNLDDLPPLAELRDLDSLSAQLALDNVGADTPESDPASPDSDAGADTEAATDESAERSAAPVEDEAGAAAELPPTDADEPQRSSE